MENTSLFSQIGLALADALKSKNGPLYIGVTAITGLVLGWKFLDDRYRFQSGDVCLEPADRTPIASDFETESSIESAEEEAIPVEGPQ